MVRRSSQVPREVQARAQLRRGEKVLAASATADGAWLLGTRDALSVVPAPPTPSTRLPWEQVERADWDREAGRLRVVEVGRFGEVRPQYLFTIDEPGLLLQLIRERVTASVLLQRRVVVSGRQGLFVIARRGPGSSGEITWAVEFDPGVDADDPDVLRLADEGLRAAREELGL